MKSLIRSAFLAAALTLAGCSPSTGPAPVASTAPTIPAYAYDVVATYPHDPAAFTQGLLIEDGQLYESTGQLGTSWVRKVDLATGQVQQQYVVQPEYFGEGMVIWGDRIITLTWQHQKGFILDRNTLELKGEWVYQGEGWGLTRDDTQIYMSDGTAQIRKLNPETLEETGRIDVTMNGRPVGKLNELEFVKGEIWANVFETDRIVRIDPASGAVTGVLHLGGLLTRNERSKTDVLNGIAWDKANDKLYVTGKLWPKLFEIKVKDPAAPATP